MVKWEILCRDFGKENQIEFNKAEKGIHFPHLFWVDYESMGYKKPIHIGSCRVSSWRQFFGRLVKLKLEIDRGVHHERT